MVLHQQSTLDDATTDTVLILRQWIDRGDLPAGTDGRPAAVLVRDGNGRLSKFRTVAGTAVRSA